MRPHYKPVRFDESKINKAYKLLIESDKQISEICYASGFESILFFTGSLRNLRIVDPKITG